MKKVLLATIFLLLLYCVSANSQDIDIGISMSNGKIRSFYFALSDYYRIPEEKIIIIKKRYPIIIEDELPVILLIVREAGVDPDVIIELRRRGYSWYDILIRFKLYPEVVFKRYIIYGPPYGKAWGYHKKKGRIVFEDRDIIVLSNMRFLSEYYKEEPEVIIKYKEKYPRFVDINYEIKEMKKEKKLKQDWQEERPFKDHPSKEEKWDRKVEKQKNQDKINRDELKDSKKEKKRDNNPFDEDRDRQGKGKRD